MCYKLSQSVNIANEFQISAYIYESGFSMCTRLQRKMSADVSLSQHLLYKSIICGRDARSHDKRLASADVSRWSMNAPF